MSTEISKSELEHSLADVFSSFVSWTSNYVITKEASPPSFCGSEIPHCPIRVAIDTTRSDRRIESRTFMHDYASTYGRMAHKLLQRWLGITGVMYGRWRCSKCGSEVALPTGSPGAVGPVYHCGTPCDYVEYVLTCKGTDYSGHCDGLLLLHGKLLPIELKVPKAEVVTRVSNEGPFSIDNIMQVTSYRSCLPEHLGLPEECFHDYVGLLYFNRGDIRKYALSVYPYRRKIFDDEVLAQTRTRKLIALKAYNRLSGLCHTSQDRLYCPYHDVCFGLNPRRELEQYLPGITDAVVPYKFKAA